MLTRFHLDEHVAFAVAAALRRRGVDVTTTEDAGLGGADDLDHIAFAAAESRVVVTHDTDFLRHAASGVAHAGIAYCHQEKYAIGSLIRRLLELHEHYSAEEMRGMVCYL